MAEKGQIAHKQRLLRTNKAVGGRGEGRRPEGKVTSPFPSNLACPEGRKGNLAIPAGFEKTRPANASIDGDPFHKT